MMHHIRTLSTLAIAGLVACSGGTTALPDASSETDPGTSNASDPSADSAASDDQGVQSQAVGLDVRIDFECAHGPDAGACAGVVGGSEMGTMLGNDGSAVGFFDAGDYLAYRELDLTGANVMTVVYATNNGGTIEFAIDDPEGPAIGSWTVAPTGGWNNWTPVFAPISEPVDGIHDLYFRGAAGRGIANLDWFRLQVCTPACEDKQCGTDGCGGVCGECEGTDFCGPEQTCEACEPDCEGKSCGDDSCGGSCGDPCAEGEVCDAARECVAYADLGGPARIHTDGNRFVDPEGAPVVLRGVSLISMGVHANWRDGVESIIDQITTEEWGTQIVRFPVYISDPPMPFSLDDHFLREAYMAEVLRPAVDYATQKGLYVIIDFHEITSVTQTKDLEAQAFWSYMARQFADYPNVVYEVFNEPIDYDFACVAGVNDDCWAPFKAQAEGWIDIIRQSAPDTLVLVGGPSWSQVIGPAADDPIDDANVGYVGHIYPDHTNGDNTAVEDQIRRCAAVHPVILTEWGFGFDEGDRDPYVGIVRDMADELELSWTAWAADYEWDPPMFDLEGTPTEFGEYTRDWLAAGVPAPDPEETPAEADPPAEEEAP